MKHQNLAASTLEIPLLMKKIELKNKALTIKSKTHRFWDFNFENNVFGEQVKKSMCG